MPRYTGKNLVVQWIHSGGTATISGNQTVFDYNPSVDLIDSTAGADAAKKHLVGPKDGSASMTSLFTSGTDTGGTITASTLVEGAGGTLIWHPEGTASGKPKYTIPAISNGAAFTYPFNGRVEMKVGFQQDGERVEASN